MKSLLILLALSPAHVKPIDVAYLVLEKDPAAIVEPLRAALASDDAIVRTTAARVIGVRDVKPLVPAVRAAAKSESDAAAAREELRTLALAGEPSDVDTAIALTAKWPASVDGEVAQAIARRGGGDAIELYFTKLTSLRPFSVADFFRASLWGRPQLATLTASRLVAASDERGFSALASVMHDSRALLDPGIVVAALGSTSPAIRSQAAWYVVHAYARTPDAVPQLLRDAVAEDAKVDAEAFARELVRRMAGGEKKASERWIEFLQSGGADRYVDPRELAELDLLTERELQTLHERCSGDHAPCFLPPVRVAKEMRGVPPPPEGFSVRYALPPGIGDALASCHGDWFGGAKVSVDTAGRVQSVELANVTPQSCAREIETMLRLSYADNSGIAGALSSSNVIIAHASRGQLCVDELPPSDAVQQAVHNVEGAVHPPKALRRVDPMFSDSARRALSAKGSQAVVMLEALITRAGCVNNIRVIRPAPIPEITASAIMALSQWTFTPGDVDGKSVDVRYAMSVSFRVNR